MTPRTGPVPLVDCHLKIRTVSEANQASHAHWRTRHRRAKAQRTQAYYELRALYGLRTVPERVHIELTRVAPRRLDDNLASACKHVRDGIADWLGIDDGSERLVWTYRQERGQPKQYLVGVRMWRL